MSVYPVALDDFDNPTPTDYLTDPDHAAQHDNINDAVETLQTKVGTGASAASGTNQFFRSTGTAESAWATAASTDLTDIDSGAPAVGDLRQWDGSSWVAVSVPLVTNLLWDGDDPASSSFLDPN